MKTGAVIFAKDLNRVANFYRDLLAMPVVHAEQDHVILESEQCEIVIHAIPKQIADSIEIASPPVRRTENAIKLFFPVASIADARARALVLGGELNPKEREWEAYGFRACDGHDPEGNVLQVRESVR